MRTFTCTVCKATKTESVAKLSTHTWDGGKITKAATCAAAGVKTFTCSVCKATKTESVAKLSTHTWDGGKVTKAATCAAEGVRTFTYTVCKATKTETIAQTADHQWDEGKITTEATCITAGITTYTCTVCGAQREESFTDRSAHALRLIPGTAPTCTNSGLPDYYQCQICMRFYFDAAAVQAFEFNQLHDHIIPATGHNWSEWQVTKAPSTAENGVETRICTLCGEEETRPIAAISPSYTLGDVDGNGKIEAADARLALRASVKLEKYEEGSAPFLAADANRDGQIGPEDARTILRVSVKLESF